MGCDPILIYLFSTKHPRSFLEEFETSLQDIKTLPTWENVNNYLTHKFETLEFVGNIKPTSTKYSQQK